MIQINKSGRSINPAQKRTRVISKEECLHDLRGILPLLFKSHHSAVKEFNKGMEDTPPQHRVRGLDPSYFASKMIQCMSEYGLEVQYGKHGRRIVYTNGYIILFKKFDRSGRPMNIKTKHNTAIEAQQAGNLFGCGDDGTAPILYFGYSVSPLGEICAPRLAYLDERRLKWAIIENDLATGKRAIAEITPKQPDGGVSVKPGVKVAKRAE